MIDLFRKFLFNDKLKVLHLTIIFIFFIIYIRFNRGVYDRLGLTAIAKDTNSSGFYKKLSKFKTKGTGKQNEQYKFEIDELKDNLKELNIIENDFKTHCEPIIKDNSDNINILNDCITGIETILGLLIVYYSLSYLFTFIFVPIFKNSSICNLKKIYKYFLKYSLLPLIYIIIAFISSTRPSLVLFIFIFILIFAGKMLEKNENTNDIIFFKFAGKHSKSIAYFTYLTLTLFYIIYLGLSLYISYHYKKNYCHIRRYYELLKLPAIHKDPSKIISIKEKMHKDLIEFNGIAIKNIILIIITLIVVGFNTDAFEHFAKYFKAGQGHLEGLVNRASSQLGKCP